MKKEEFLQLIDKYLSGQASPKEEELLIRFFESFQGEETGHAQAAAVKQELEEKMLRRLMEAVHERSSTITSPAKHTRPLFRWPRMAAAVTILLAAGSICYYIYSTRALTTTPVSDATTGQQAAKPAGNKALLQLADGSTIELNEASNGVLAMQGSTAIRKTKDGQLIYEAGHNGQALGSVNTISTPKGGQYQLTLPDGTRVWLNAGSSLTFPTVFDSAGRHVELKGEAYFEVAKVNMGNGRARLPFYVKAGQNEVEVLGTHFNVKDYAAGAAFEATLLEGAVRVKHGVLAQQIVPGQQASIRGNGPIKVAQANTEAVMAWKEGLFLFDDTGIDEAMEEISRWYDMEVIYAGAKPHVAFTGVLPRNSSVTQVLNLLESAEGVQFEIKDKQIIVRQQ